MIDNRRQLSCLNNAERHFGVALNDNVLSCRCNYTKIGFELMERPPYAPDLIRSDC